MVVEVVEVEVCLLPVDEVQEVQHEETKELVEGQQPGQEEHQQEEHHQQEVVVQVYLDLQTNDLQMVNKHHRHHHHMHHDNLITIVNQNHPKASRLLRRLRQRTW